MPIKVPTWAIRSSLSVPPPRPPCIRNRGATRAASSRVEGAKAREPVSRLALVASPPKVHTRESRAGFSSAAAEQSLDFEAGERDQQAIGQGDVATSRVQASDHWHLDRFGDKLELALLAFDRKKS